MLALFFLLLLSVSMTNLSPFSPLFKKLLALKVISSNSHTHGELLYFYQLYYTYTYYHYNYLNSYFIIFVIFLMCAYTSRFTLVNGE